ncbi:MAG: hypothetical protein RL266_1263 [Bacteroidota bacterium]|jgi:uncharacterized protein (TIGR02145 family)
MRTLAFLLFALWCEGGNAQALMNIHQAGQPLLQIPINDIDSITYSVVGDPGALPLVTTLPLGAFTAETAELGGIVDGNGGTTITQRGVAWGTAPAPTTAGQFTIDGSGTGTFVSLIEGLSSNTIYYARAYAINNAGIAYGNDIIFQVTNDPYLPGNGVTDIDGNFYQTIHASSGQEWMIENLKVCRYANGDSILHLESELPWSISDSGAWCTYNNNNANTDVFGKLYNGWAVEDPRNVCPEGWHVPSAPEWDELHAVNNGYSFGGGNLKKTGIDLWLAPNTGATNSSGFTALPGGRRLGGGVFQESFGSGYWWTSSGNSSTLTTRILYYTSNGVWIDDLSKYEGLSIRCVKD